MMIQIVIQTAKNGCEILSQIRITISIHFDSMGMESLSAVGTLMISSSVLCSLILFSLYSRFIRIWKWPLSYQKRRQCLKHYAKLLNSYTGTLQLLASTIMAVFFMSF